MNPYERAREERIASNRARLAALDLPGMASKFIDTHVSKPKRPSAPRGLAAKRQKKRVSHLVSGQVMATASALSARLALDNLHCRSWHLFAPRGPQSCYTVFFGRSCIATEAA